MLTCRSIHLRPAHWSPFPSQTKWRYHRTSPARGQSAYQKPLPQTPPDSQCSRSLRLRNTSRHSSRSSREQVHSMILPARTQQYVWSPGLLEDWVLQKQQTRSQWPFVQTLKRNPTTTKGTVRAPVFGRSQNDGTSKHYRKTHRSLLSGLIINHSCWPMYIQQYLIVDYSSAKGGLKVIDCIVLSSEYWCPNGRSSNLLHYVPQFF